MIGKYLANRHKQKPKLHFTRGLFQPAIAELEVSLYTAKNNEPINRKEGNTDQADLERGNAKSYKAAISLLKKQK